jgi:hypothetical protein
MHKQPQLQKNPKIMNDFFLHAITKPPHAITTQKKLQKKLKFVL